MTTRRSRSPSRTKTSAAARTRTAAPHRKKREVALPAPSGPPRRVLVATDDSPAAAAALRWARKMADAGHWSPSVVTVLEPAPVAVGELVYGAATPMLDNTVMDALIDRIRDQVRKHGSPDWELTVEFGRVAYGIVEAARRGGAELIVLGVGHHGRLARLLGADTSARVARLSPVPVLAVHPGTKRLPRVVVVAVDFGESSTIAAHEAVRLLPPDGRLHLVHVRWALNGQPLYDQSVERTYKVGVDESFARLERDLQPRAPGVTITHEMRMGQNVEEILKATRAVSADMIALGSHNRGLVDRLLIGSTPALLLRTAEQSLLLVPPRAEGRDDGQIRQV